MYLTDLEETLWWYCRYFGYVCYGLYERKGSEGNCNLSFCENFYTKAPGE